MALSVIVPLLLAAWVRGAPARDHAVRMVLALSLICGWLGWYAMLGARGWLTPGNALPLNLCDWAEAALIVALVGAATIAGAWFFQLVIGLKPCPMCLEQRWPYYIGVPLAVVVALAAQRRKQLGSRDVLSGGAAGRSAGFSAYA